MKWTEKEKQYLAKHYPNTPRDIILKNIKNRNWIAIRAYAKKTKIRRVLDERPKIVNNKNNKHTNLINKKFGKLTVISFAGYIVSKRKNRSNEIIREWNCVCECGSKKIVKRRECNIIYNKGSCGCNQIEHLKRIHLKNVNPNAAFEYVYKTYKTSAELNNREFSLSIEEFKSLTSNNCFYCGVEPSRTKDGYNGIKFKNSIYKWNGIDRKDSSKGYTYENCLTCCTICNIAKKDMLFEDFLNWVDKIYKNLKDKDLI